MSYLRGCALVSRAVLFRPAISRLAVASSIGLAAIALVGCSNGQQSSRQSGLSPVGSRSQTIDPRYGTSASPRLYSETDRIPKGGGTYKLGTPYKVAGRWYFPAEDRNYKRIGTASWYGADFHGRKTANGEVFDMWALTAAHPTLPLPSYAYVTNVENGRTVLVRINDRGPYAHDRLIDLSRMTARVLGTEAKGLGRVEVRYAGRAPLDGNDTHERRFLASQPWAQQFAAGPFPGRMSLGVPTLGRD